MALNRRTHVSYPRRFLTVVLAAAAALVGVPALAMATPTPPAPSITITAPESVKVGESFSVSVTAPGTTDLYAYGATLEFDPAKATAQVDQVVSPEGGFSDVRPSDTGLAISHTRLGTSPGLTGDVELFSVSFTAKASGPLTLDVSSFTQVDSAQVTNVATDVASHTVTITAVPGGEGENPDPGDNGGQTPPPDDGNNGSPDKGTTPAGDNAKPQKSLASTGASVGIIAAIAAVVAAAGVTLVLSRKSRKS